MTSILLGNKLVISTSAVSYLLNTELANLLSRSIAHFLLQQRMENESVLPSSFTSHICLEPSNGGRTLSSFLSSRS